MVSSTSTSSIQNSSKYDMFSSFSGEDTCKNIDDHLYTYKDDEEIQKGEKSIESITSSIQKRFKYDVFLSFRGEDTRKNFVDHLYHALKDKGIYTYKDDEKIKKGKRISDDLLKSIEDAKFYIIVFSKNYSSSSWCLDELVKIMECQKMNGHTAYPFIYVCVESHLNPKTKVWHVEISLELRSINFGFDEKLVGMETRVKDVISSLEIGIDEVRMIGIKGMGGAGKTTTARAVFDHLSNDFEAKIFVGSVREVSKASMFGLKNLQEQILSKVLNEQVTLDSVDDGKNMMKKRMCGKKVLLVIDDVDHIEQLKALAGEPKWFKPGSRILITTRDEQVLVAHRVNIIRDIVLLSKQEAISLFSRYAFGTENPLQGYEKLSGKVVRYAAGLPLTIEVLGSFLCGKDKLEWVDVIARLKRIPLKETLEKLELSYISLEDEYKEIFLDIACMLKGQSKKDAIRILESCGFHARIGLKVLEQRSLITIISSKYDQVLGMHDHIEEMGKNIVRRSHPDEPNQHSRLWIYEEIEDILANDMGTEETRCLKLDMSRRNSRIVMKGLGKMKKLRYLEVNYADSDPEFDHTSQYFTNSLKYLKCTFYPFSYLPRTFQANNLVGLDMSKSRLVQLWEEGEKKDLQKLKFLFLSESELTTFDMRITPNLEELSLDNSYELKELRMPVTCQKLKYLHISHSKFMTFDLGLTPNFETLSLFVCTGFVKLQVPFACPNLKFLILRKSRLRSLDLELIPNLERLDLEGCCRRGKFNEDIGQLEFLERVLDLSATMIKHSPESICMLKHLEYLNLHLCAILEELPVDLGRLRCLQDISRLPQNIFGLKDITAYPELLHLYDFPSEIKITTRHFRLIYVGVDVEVLMDLPDDVNIPDLGAENGDELGDEIGETVDNEDVVQIGTEEEFIVVEIGDEIVADIDKGDGVRKKRMSRPRVNGISIIENEDPSYGSDSESEESLKSFDYLSEGEAEVIELRKRMTKFRSGVAEGEEEVEGSDNDQNDSFDDEGFVTPKRMFDIGISDTVKEHEQDMNALMRRIKGKGCELKDPFTMVDKTEKYPIYDEATHWKLKKPKLGEKFVNVDQFKECLTYYALANGFSLWYETSSKDMVVAKCGHRKEVIKDPSKGKQRQYKKFPTRDPTKVDAHSVCPWRCYGKMLKGVNSFQVISLKDEHTCVRNYNYGTLINYKWLGKHFGDKIRANPHIRLLDIADLVMKKYNCIVSPNQCRRAKSYALSEGESSLQDHYGLLRSYAKAIADSNVGSTVKVGVTVNPDEKTYFDRFYVCLKGLKEGWKLGCRKIIALDGCFLKKPNCGEILTAVGRDGNNQIYPVAWAIVTVENKDNWSWFLSLLGDDLDLPTGYGLTLISDQHKCARHIYEGFRKQYSGVEFRQLFWAASKASYPQLFWHVIPAGESKFEVRKGYDDFTVDEVANTCSYRMWQILGPLPKKMPSRPKKKRIRVSHESQSTTKISMSGLEMTCHNCWQKVHNKKGCKNDPILKTPKVKGKVGRPKKTIPTENTNLVDDEDLPRFVNNSINKFYKAPSKNYVVFNDGVKINLGRNWNTNKRGGKSGGTCFVKMKGGKSSRGGLVPTERLGRIGGWLGLDAAILDPTDPTEDRQPFQRSAFIGSTSSSPRVARQTMTEPTAQEQPNTQEPPPAQPQVKRRQQAHPPPREKSQRILLMKVSQKITGRGSSIDNEIIIE
ncbi:disease resistance TIR-NBS-LRR class family protein [Tanacetum coccineum]